MLFRALFVSLIIHLLLLIGWPTGGALSHVRHAVVLTEEGHLYARLADIRAERAMLRDSVRRPRSAPPGQSAGRHGLSRARVVTESAPLATDARRDVSTAPSEAEPEADILRQYCLAIGQAARRFKQLSNPFGAHEVAGDVRILIRLNAGSAVPLVELAEPGRPSELAAAALALVGLAARSVPVPESLQGRPYVLSLQIRYAQLDE